jgi:hypothetical protein
MAFLAHADRMLTAPETRFPYVKILTRHALQLSRPRDLDTLLTAIHRHGSNATLLCRVHYERGLWLLGRGHYPLARADFEACERLASDAHLKSASEFYALKCGLLLSEPDAAQRAESLLADSTAPPNRDDLLIALIEHYGRRALHHDALRCCLFFEQTFRPSVKSPEYMHARLSVLHGWAFACDPPDPLLLETVASYTYECAEVAVKTSHPAYLRYDLSCLLRTYAALNETTAAANLVRQLWPDILSLDAACSENLVRDMPIILGGLSLGSDEVCSILHDLVHAAESDKLRQRLAQAAEEGLFIAGFRCSLKQE